MEKNEEFYTIDRNAEAEIIEKRSRFIAHLFYVETVEEAENYVKNIKKKYHDAKHNVFAYSVKNKENGIINKCNDDGEPSGTAGQPLLKVLSEKKLKNVLIVITRYFGGILLGTGGLVRAYTNAMLKALENVKIIKKYFGYELEIEIEYCDFDKVKYFLEKCKTKILNVEYCRNIKINVEISQNDLEKITSKNSKKGFEILKCDILREKFI